MIEHIVREMILDILHILRALVGVVADESI
jgi:hypothetical protein